MRAAGKLRKQIFDLLPLDGPQAVPWTALQISRVLVDVEIWKVSETLGNMARAHVVRCITGRIRTGSLWVRIMPKLLDKRGKHGKHAKGQAWNRKHRKRAARPATPQHGAQFKTLAAMHPAIGLESWPRLVLLDDIEST